MKNLFFFALFFLFSINTVYGQITNNSNVPFDLKNEKPISFALRMELNDLSDENLFSTHLSNAAMHKRNSLNYSLCAFGSSVISSVLLFTINDENVNSFIIAAPFYILSAIFAGSSIYHSYKNAEELEKAADLYHKRHEIN